jgi:hypothetical protein
MIASYESQKCFPWYLDFIAKQEEAILELF